ncbi:hypothetical protein [Nostoc flagelliforme]|nr:hypothetical protein [Nostoc flagelliforme]
MSIATITRTSYPSPTSQATFLSMLDTAMQVAGFTLFDSKNISTIENRIYSLAVSNAAKGTVYLRMQLTTGMVITARLSALWNTSTNTATNEGTVSSNATFSLSSLATISFTAINSAELKGVLIVQNITSFLLGVIRPANLESWYDESQFNFAFTADNSNNPNVYGTTLIPASVASSWGMNFSSFLSGSNPYNANIRQIRPIEFFHPSAFGSVGYTSNDLVWAACSGISNTGIDELITSNSSYLYLGKSSGQSCALAVRIS